MRAIADTSAIIGVEAGRIEARDLRRFELSVSALTVLFAFFILDIMVSRGGGSRSSSRGTACLFVIRRRQWRQQ